MIKGAAPRHQARRSFPATRLRRSALCHPSQIGAQHVSKEPGAGSLPEDRFQDRPSEASRAACLPWSGHPCRCRHLQPPDSRHQTLRTDSQSGQPVDNPLRYQADSRLPAPSDGSRRCDLVISVLTVTSGFMSCGTRDQVAAAMADD
jgi:hypothetical protein